MPSKLPYSTQKLRPADVDLSRVQDSLANPLDALLAFAIGLQSGGTAEALSVASLVATGAVQGATVKATAGVTGATVAATGNVSGGTVTSAAGFKTLLGPFVYSTTSTVHLAFPAMEVACYVEPGHTVGGIGLSWAAPFAGSIVGVSLCNTPTAATTTSVFPSIAGVNPVSLTLASSGVSTFATYAKGLYTFAAGNVIAMSVDYGTAGLTTNTVAYLVLELAA